MSTSSTTSSSPSSSVHPDRKSVPPTGNSILEFDEKNVNDSPRQVVVFGGGTFGTAVGTLFARNGHKVCLMVRREHRCASINESHKNPDYLSEYTLLDNITAVMADDASEILQQAQIIVHAIPVQASQSYLEKIRPYIAPDTPVVSLSKGIHHEKLTFMNQIIADALGKDHPTAFLSGPSFARELMDEQPTGLVCATEPAATKLASTICAMITSKRIRVYVSTDVIGVEVGGALKNVYAIAAGIAHGMGLHKNTAALIVTRGCNEMKKLAVKMGARPSTLAGLSGIGDLMLTCFGGASRNRTVGVRLGKGEKLDDIIASMREVAEGVPTVGAVITLAEKFELDLPVARAVNSILEGEAELLAAMDELMESPAGTED
jgi:glycerol-3-phosphate dehydrogenase (NAD+)